MFCSSFNHLERIATAHNGFVVLFYLEIQLSLKPYISSACALSCQK